jgi:hypothetical protein
MKNGFIKIDKSILEWGWYQDPNTFRLWLHLLIKANWKDNKFQNLLIKRGQLVTSVKSLSEDLELTAKQIRTSLKKLISTNEISTKTTNKFTIISIENYCLYQGNKTQEGQTKGKQRATIEDIKEEKNINPLTPLEDSEQNSNSEISGGEGIKNLSFDDIEKALDKKTKNYINDLGSFTVEDLAKILIERVNSEKKPYPECIKTEMIKLAEIYRNQSPSPYSVIKEESLSSENSEVKKKKNFKKNHVIEALTDQDIELIKKAAPQWDVHNLAEEYVLAVNGGNLDQPILINRHFVAFCKGRAKGMPPP